ncbi:MAG: hypothetical protein COZ04_01605 [Candidatus Aenigmarchaeota archaeon CG_4_10_14_3_um_filter_37_21]|nr:MAG: hypothetical protein AUJ50_03365 [Candidatus Aenigmarchaeota archaeon CG1_02_38_14]PIX50506.1 MAG: hypothetical protein COZ52_03710 [Candidatus Aenigmarchaeota archaeon CG_4_8_14_3_um_filter_37_24]PIY36009.1 MAG: hypothetical protein COZ04_01605 [Candidatus Aenigmarchaeota archaeon CG_4_10_14_3_um_filter_37_21]
MAVFKVGDYLECLRKVDDVPLLVPGVFYRVSLNPQGDDCYRLFPHPRSLVGIQRKTLKGVFPVNREIVEDEENFRGLTEEDGRKLTKYLVDDYIAMYLDL